MPLSLERPIGVPVAIARYRVPFFDTDAMGVVHHANYVRYLELGRIQFLSEFDRPYAEFVASGRHVAVTGVQTQHHLTCGFDDVIEVCCWLRWIRTASLSFGYVLTRGDDRILSATTEHAVVTLEGRATRIPAEVRKRLSELCSG